MLKAFAIFLLCLYFKCSNVIVLNIHCCQLHNFCIPSQCYTLKSVSSKTIIEIFKIYNYIIFSYYYSSTLVDDSNASFTIIIFPDIPTWFSYGLLYILGIIHLILAVWMVAEYFILEKPNILLPRLPEVLMKEWVVS